MHYFNLSGAKGFKAEVRYFHLQANNMKGFTKSLAILKTDDPSPDQLIQDHCEQSLKNNLGDSLH